MRNIGQTVCLGAVLSLFAAAASYGAEEKFSQLKVGSEVYSNVVVTTVTATDIYFSHSRGMGNAKLKNLSPELQEHFHYNAAKASEVEQQRREGNARYHEGLATNAPPAASPKHKQPTGTDDGDVVVPKLYAKSFRGEHVPDIFIEQWIGPVPDLTNKFGLVLFWSPDSDPCKDAIPHMNELYEKFHDKVSFFGMTDKPAEEVQKVTPPQLEFSTAIDTQQRTMRFIELEAIPHVILADKQGTVRFEGMPAYLTQKALEQLLEKYEE